MPPPLPTTKHTHCHQLLSQIFYMTILTAEDAQFPRSKRKSTENHKSKEKQNESAFSQNLQPLSNNKKIPTTNNKKTTKYNENMNVKPACITVDPLRTLLGRQATTCVKFRTVCLECSSQHGAYLHPWTDTNK